MTAESLIHFGCSHCGKKLQAPKSAVGKAGKCKHCGTKNLIPSESTVEQSLDKVSRQAKPTSSTPTRSSTPQNTAPSPKKPHGTSSNKPQSIDEVAPAIDFGSALQDAIAEGSTKVEEKLANKLTPADIQRAIRSDLPKRSVSMAYRIQLFVVAIVMATLPVLYLLFVAAVGFAVFFYCSTIAPPLFASIRPGRMGVFLYLGVASPAIAGGILLLFMIKPLFFRTHEDRRRRSLNRQAQPVLFALVDRICEATGAPKPVRIDVDYDVNASASPEKGLFSVASGRMVLTIGVPLIAGLSSRQLAGVLAHEFGHFAQKFGMGTSILIRKVNFWFARVVYQRDSFDVTLDEWIDEADVRIGLILQLAKVCVFISRGILWCFMMLGYAVSSGLMRQMEFDADRYEYGLVGSKTFADNCYELHRQQVAQSQALEAMFRHFQKGQLADDLIQISQHFRRTLSYETERKIREAVENQTTGLLATHPSDASRIERAAKAKSEGIFDLDRPASELVWYYEPLCKGVTWDFYRDQFGGHVSPNALTPSGQLMDLSSPSGTA